MSNSPKNPPPTRKEREQAQHHQDILDAAERLFGEHSYHQTTMQMIADRAEFSVGYLYKHFNGKEDMYREMLTFHLGRMDTLMSEVQDMRLDPLAQIHRNYSVICGHFNHHPNFMRIFHEEIAGEFPELKESKRQHACDIKELLTAAQESGQLKALDASLLAAAIQGATKELFVELASRSGESPFDPMPDLIYSIFIKPHLIA